MPAGDQGPLGPEMEERLRRELDAVQPRFSPPRYLSARRPPVVWRLAPAALAAVLLGVLGLAAYAGSPNPVVWTEHVFTVLHPQASPAATPPATSPKPSPTEERHESPEPSETAEPHETPEPSGGGGSESGGSDSSGSGSSGSGSGESGSGGSGSDGSSSSSTSDAGGSGSGGTGSGESSPEPTPTSSDH